MPVVAVGIAGLVIGAAAELGTTLSIVAAVGATVSAVGAVTGSKPLQIGGAVLGAVGGIGALAKGANLLPDFSSMFGSATAPPVFGFRAARASAC
jgi:hypothetical protein